MPRIFLKEMHSLWRLVQHGTALLLLLESHGVFCGCFAFLFADVSDFICSMEVSRT